MCPQTKVRLSDMTRIKHDAESFKYNSAFGGKLLRLWLVFAIYQLTKLLMTVLKFFPLHVLFFLRTPSQVYLWQKNMITFTFFTNIHYKLTIFYLLIGKVSFVRLINLPPGTSISLTNRTLQIDKHQISC
jgi:hypothetical protein